MSAKSWIGETRPNGKGQFQDEHLLVPFSKPSHTKPYITWLFSPDQSPRLTLPTWYLQIKPVLLCIFAKSWIGETRPNSKGQFQEEHLVPFSKLGPTNPSQSGYSHQPPWLTLTPWHLKIKPVLLCIFATSWIGETRDNSKGQLQEEHLVRPPQTPINLAVQTIQPPWLTLTPWHIKI